LWAAAVLAFGWTLAAAPSEWKYYASQDGVSVSWRWELRDGAYRADLRFANSTPKALQVSFRPFYETRTGKRWSDGGQAFVLEPYQTKGGEGVGTSYLPTMFSQPPRFGGYQSLVVRALEASTSPLPWVLDQELDGVAIEWRPLRLGTRYGASLRLSNTGGARQVRFQAAFTNTKGQIWLSGLRTLNVPARAVLVGEEHELDFLPVYHSYDPYTSHDLWLASTEPPVSGGILLP
jgi:hypothetical protein